MVTSIDFSPSHVEAKSSVKNIGQKKQKSFVSFADPKNDISTKEQGLKEVWNSYRGVDPTLTQLPTDHENWKLLARQDAAILRTDPPETAKMEGNEK